MAVWSYQELCAVFKQYAKISGQLKLFLCDDIHSDQIVYIKTFQTYWKPVMHSVDTTTRSLQRDDLRTNRFIHLESHSDDVRSMSALVREISSLTILENTMGHTFAGNVGNFHIATNSIPLESGHSMSIIERYHFLLRREIVLTEMEALDFDKN